MFVIGQNLNSASPTVHSALAAGARGWVETCVRAQMSAGVDAIDCCAATFGRAEADVLRWLVEIVETVGDVPVAVDSPRTSVLMELAERRRRPPLLNSVDAGGRWPGSLVAAVRDHRASVVVQLRQEDGSIPRGLDDRQAWTAHAVESILREGIDLDRVWIDPVLLPWAEDLEAGRPLLEYLRHAAHEWPGLQTLVGLSNVSYGARDRSRLHRTWLVHLRDAGLHGVLLDPLDAQVLTLARGEPQ